ncbi:MAG: AAA family ATPase [Chlamydiia bacterium]|nr:AAA family ATPase [Chlamydiia bacterium]
MSFFLGRKEELKRLERLKALKKSVIGVIKGRRRVGKSTLAKEFAKGSRFISISGNPPMPGTTPQTQRDSFADQLCAQLHLPKVTFKSWFDAFKFLGEQIGEEETLVLLDEISWMGDVDPDFLGALKTWWDEYGSAKKHLILILCSSISPWIEENILCSTGFVGRIALVIHLKPLTILDSLIFLKKKGFKGSAYDAFKILSVTGGIPWYLDLINVKESADENIYEICFASSSQLVNEFRTIFHDLFDKKGATYASILKLLVEGMKTQKEIRESLGLDKGGHISQLLSHLVSAGFVSEHYQWDLKSKKIGRTKLYRLSDCYIRFHLKYVAPHSQKMTQGKTLKGILPSWDAIMGFQLESLLLTNREFLFDALGLDPDTIACDNPYIQRGTTRHKGCQIDYLIQTTSNTLILCEFKFRKKELDTSIIREIDAKSRSLSAPRGFGKAPVLFHIGGVSPKVEESPLFYRIIDLRDLFDLS